MSTEAPLLERIASRDRATQRGACREAATRLRDEPGLRAELLRLLKEGSPLGRFGAAFVLFHAQPGLRVLPALLDALELEDGDLRWSATHMLALLGRTQPEVLPVLVEEARGAVRPRRRRMALYVLRELGPEREEVQRVLLDALDDPDADVQRAALSSLPKLLEPTGECLDRTLHALQDSPDPRMRRIAAVAAPDVAGGDPARLARARAALEHARRDEDPDLARAAGLALRRMEEMPG